MSNGKKWKIGDDLNDVANLNQMLPAAFASVGSGLTLTVEAITYLDNFVKKVFAGGTLLMGAGLTDQAVWLDSAQVLQQGAAFPVSGSFLALVLVSTNAADIVSITQMLQLSGAGVSAGGGAPPTHAGDVTGDTTLTVVSVGGKTAAEIAQAVDKSLTRVDPGQFEAGPSGILQKSLPTLSDKIIIEDSADGQKKKGISIGSMPFVGLGSPGAGKEVYIGEGAPYVASMVVLTSPNLEVGPFTDITALVNGPLLPTDFLAEANLSTIFIGSDHRFTGLQVKPEIPFFNGNPFIEFEQWNGGFVNQWKPLGMMATQLDLNGVESRVSIGEDILKTLDDEEWRFNTPEISSISLVSWDKKTINGVSKYWLRARVNNAAGITEGGKFKDLKLIAPSVRIRGKGVIEYFSHSPPELKLHESVSGDKRENIVLPDAPANQNILWSSNIADKERRNTFANGLFSGRVFAIRIPNNLDTSKPVKVAVMWHPFDNTASPVEWRVNAQRKRQGDEINLVVAPADVTQLKTFIFTTNGNNRALYESPIELDLTRYRPGDVLTMSVERDARAPNVNDTYPFSVYLVNVSVTGKRWK